MPVTLNWSKTGPHGAATYHQHPQPRAICNQPCHLQSPPTPRFKYGRRLHKVCLERWLDKHPEYDPITLLRKDDERANTAQQLG